MNCYEGMYILDPSLTGEKQEEVINSLKAELAEKGEVFAVDCIGNKQLSHPIKQSVDGNYVVIYFSYPPDMIDRLKSRYKLNSSILRVMIMRRKEEEIRRITEKFKISKTEAEKSQCESETAPAFVMDEMEDAETVSDLPTESWAIDEVIEDDKDIETDIDKTDE